MFAIDLKSEKGGALFASVFFLILLGMMGISLITITLSDQKMNTIEGKERQAFYATQAGIEYGMRRVFETNPSSFGLPLCPFSIWMSCGICQNPMVTMTGILPCLRYLIFRQTISLLSKEI